MANKKLLGTATSDLRLPGKKVRGEKKPKWQAKTGGKKKMEPVGETPEVVVDEVVIESPVQEEPTLPLEPTETPVVATTLDDASVEPATVDEAATKNDCASSTELPAIEPTTSVDQTADDTTTKKPRKLKLKADVPPKKLREA